MDIVGLIKLADALDASGFAKEAGEIDELIALAVRVDYGPQAYIDNFFRMLDESDQETFSKEEIKNIFNAVENKLREHGKEVGQQLEKGSAWEFASGIKALTDDIDKLKVKIESDPQAASDYENDIATLAANVSAVHRMDGLLPGREDKEKAAKIKELAGDYLPRAQALLEENYNSKFSGDSVGKLANDFRDADAQYRQLINNRSALRDAITERRTEMQAERGGMELTRDEISQDQAISDLFRLEKELEGEGNRVRQQANKVMAQFNQFSAVSPQGGSTLINSLGDVFSSVADVARGEEGRL